MASAANPNREQIYDKVDTSEVDQMFIEKHCQSRQDQHKNAAKCSNSDCSMYLFLTMSKLSFFVSLIGFILLATSRGNDDSILIWMQLLISALAILHFILLASSHVTHTRCARSLNWRLLHILSLVVKVTIIGLTMFLTYARDYNNGMPAWYLWISLVLSVADLIYELVRYCHLRSHQKKTASIIYA